MNIIIWTTLCYPPGCPRPFGAYQMASWMREHGYTVKVIDFCYHMTTEELVTVTKKYITDDTFVVGVSSTFWFPIEQDKKLSDRTQGEPEWVVTARNIIQNEYPHLDWALGGPGVSYPKIRLDWIKFSGDGEDSFLKYADEKTGRNIEREPFEITTANTRYHETDFIDKNEALPIELGRGCQFKCKFCRFHHLGKEPGTYLRSYECVKNEMLYNYETFGTTKYIYIDDTVNEDYGKVLNLVRLAKEMPFELEWVGYIRADLIYAKPETMHLLKESGLRSCLIGVESLNQDTSKLIGKGWSGKRGKEFLVKLKDEWERNKISMFLTFIVGLPKEDKESLRETYNWLKENKFRQWAFYPLSITRVNMGSVWTSEFDRNHHLYGYKFPNPLSHVYWENELWTTDTAIQFATELQMEKLADNRRYTCFTLADVSSLGFSMKELIETPVTEELLQEIEKRKKQFIQTYIKKSLEYELS